MGSIDPLRITVDEEGQAVAPTQELIGVCDVDLQAERDRWVVDWEREGSTIAHGVRRELSGTEIPVVSLAGEHDLHTAPKVQEALRGVIGAGARATVVDLTETTFLDSSILHVLLTARKELRDGERLLLVTNDAKVKRVFEIAGIERFFDFYPSRCAAEKEVRST